ncbi:MAG: glutamate synthase [Alphaproteobacteria bacterium 32-64-14]|nr:MAG: glutamate synthase [Alphaproteobacteria bacterium 32-64-14]
MGKPTGFLEFDRQERDYEEPDARRKNYAEFLLRMSDRDIRTQAARCMSCGIPFCQGTGSVAPGTPGCPVNNQIPDWNDLVYRDHWKAALENLHSTNNFPEFTGRVCPAPCEASCVLNINDNPVAIKAIECEIVDRGWDEGWIKPQTAPRGTGKRIAIVGSGPAGLACAQQLARAGHSPTVFEKSDRIGGLLRYGIPDFKMEKHPIDKRMRQMESEGVIFRTRLNVGVDVTVQRLLDDYQVLVMAGGAENPRDLPIPGRNLDGVHYAMDFLTQQNKRVAGDDEKTAAPGGTITAKSKHVVVIGGGDTGSDCIGTSNRHGAASVTQLEIMPKPPSKENKAMTWPDWPLKLRTSSSHEEGCERDFAVVTKRAIGEDGKVTALVCARIEWVRGPNGMEMKEVEGSEFELKAQSLVVWAIREGRQCARAVDEFLMTTSNLPR